MKPLILVTLSFFLLSCKAQDKSEQPATAQDDNTLLWEISGKDISKPSYLFGTFHMMCKDDIHFSKNLLDAIHRSDEVYFEMDLDDPANTLGAMFYMNMKGDTTLKDLYTPDEYKRVESYFKDTLKVPLTMLGRMKPMMLEALIYPKLMPCKNMSGIEQELMAIAKKEKKEIKGFETIAFQASVFDSIPYKDQAIDLLKNLDSMEVYKVYFDSMLNVYKNQELQKLAVMMNDSIFGDTNGQELLLDRRNKNWVDQLEKIMKGSSVFIAVGAGHLPGNSGVIELLKKRGYTVRPLQNK